MSATDKAPDDDDDDDDDGLIKPGCWWVVRFKLTSAV